MRLCPQFSVGCTRWRACLVPRGYRARRGRCLSQIMHKRCEDVFHRKRCSSDVTQGLETLGVVYRFSAKYLAIRFLSSFDLILPIHVDATRKIFGWRDSNSRSKTVILYPSEPRDRGERDSWSSTTIATLHTVSTQG